MMRQRIPLAVVAAVTIAFAFVATFAGTARAATPATPRYYLSLGDSLAASYQPNGDEHDGYAEQLFAYAKQQEHSLKLHKLGCGGETTASMMDGSMSYCSYPKGSQLAQAVAFLSDHLGQVAFVTIDLGANDVLACVDGVRLDFGCMYAVLPEVEQNLATILDALHAAGGSTPILGMSYYNPFLGLWLDGKHGRKDARHDEAGVEVMNAALTDSFQASGVPVADVAGGFAISDWSKGGKAADQRIPVNVANACAWTWFCSDGDIHANTDGYGVIAAAFEPLLGRTSPQRGSVVIALVGAGLRAVTNGLIVSASAVADGAISRSCGWGISKRRRRTLHAS